MLVIRKRIHMNRCSLLNCAGALAAGASPLLFLKTKAWAATNDNIVMMIGNTIRSCCRRYCILHICRGMPATVL